MTLELSEKEQIEMIKNWWRENGKFTIATIVVVVILSVGWRYWQTTKNQEAAKASLLYEQMLSHEINHQYREVEFDVKSLMSSYPKTPYALLAAFISAQNAVNEKRIDTAIHKLNWIVKNSNNTDFKQIAKLRKSRIFLSIKRYDEALKSLEIIEAQAYLPAVNEVRGDIYSAVGNKQQALQAYQKALSSLKKDAPNRQLLKIKYEQLDG